MNLTLPFALPDWLPWWVPIVLLVPSLLYALLLLAMPFNVFGVKGRLDAMEARLDEIQGEIRTLALRLPEPLRHGGYEDQPYVLPVDRGAPAPPSRPPIPPAPVDLDPGFSADPLSGRAIRAARREETRLPPERARRAEPRLDPR